MDKQLIIPDPEKRLKVTKRYLHALAILQGSGKDPKDWNINTLAELLSHDEKDKGKPTDSNVLNYINNNLIAELGLDINIKKGVRRFELIEPLDDTMLESVAKIYSTFVVEDSTRDVILKTLIKKHQYDCLWMMARIYFAIVEKKKIIFDYTNNKGERSEGTTVHPYHMVFRNNNLYLIARMPGRDNAWLFILNKIENLKVTNDVFDDEVPPVESIFKDTLGSFIGKKYNVKIRFDRDINNTMEQILSILEPDIKEIEDGNRFEASFTISDDRYLCKQLFLYGDQVEILEPPELRKIMIEMLRESLAAYGE